MWIKMSGRFYNLIKKSLPMRSAKLENRILFFSPSVQAGWEKESHRLDFEFIQELGKGSFGVVHKVMHKKSKRVFAIKQIRKKTLDSAKLVEQAKIEVKIMYSLNSPHIIKLYNHFEDEVSIYLVIEFAARGQLYKFMRSQPERKFPEEVASQYVRQVTQGIKQIHRQNIMHRDIKPENILITENGVLKVADFGLSHFYGIQDRSTYCGTLDYLAPEMLQKGHEHNYRVDIWSIGVLIYELCTGQSPFSQELIKQNMINEERVKVNIKMIKYTMPEYLSDSCRDLIRKILIFSPSNRPTTQEILAHPWISRKNLQQQDRKKETKDWLEALKKQMKTMFPEDPVAVENEKEYCFSNEQIYNYTRPDSILNLRPLKPKRKPVEKFQKLENKISGDNQKDQTKIQNQSGIVHKLEERIKYLEKMHEQDQIEIRMLKSKQDHRQCQEESRKMMEEMVKQKNEILSLSWKLAESEKKVMMYERKHFGL